MADAVLQMYQGEHAAAYDARRAAMPKWEFEERALADILRAHQGQIRGLIDAPVGTGRFLKLYQRVLGDVQVHGLDRSIDMLDVARGQGASRHVTLQEQDILGAPFDIRADAVVCFRFLNLLPWKEATRALRNLFAATDRLLVMAIRTVDDDYEGETFIEDKIHLHRRSAFERLCADHRFRLVHETSCETGRAGDYRIVAYAPERPIRESRVNKNQRLIYTYGRTKPEGKIYEVKDAEHARFIQAVSQQPALSGCFPGIVGLGDRFVDAEWVDGDLLTGDTWREPIELLVRIQSLPFAHASSFDYVEDLVIPRFRKAWPLVGGGLYEAVVAAIRALSATFDLRVSHPDVIPGNVVASAEGPVIVDNELLCRTRHYRVDVLNMLNNLPVSARAQVLCDWLRLTGNTVDGWEAHREYLSNLWLARQVGSALVSNRLEQARQCAGAFEHGENVLPYDVAEVRRLTTPA
jgi:hypothetical protein